MTYLVLARKWRPQTFEELVGQEHVARTLQNAVRNGRLAHAFLFAGPRGVGKTSAARILAKVVNCLEGPSPVPCNRCRNCQEIAAGSSLDVLEIDGASNTGVDNVRELRENVKYLPNNSRYKVYIIDEVHMLSTSAFNALLKTLEEPPAHILFVFATTEPQKIPLTILSRCQRFDFKRIPTSTIFERLRSITTAEQLAIDDKSLMLVAREAEGSMRDAQSILDQIVSYAAEGVTEAEVREVLGLADRRVVFDLSEAVIRGDASGCLRVLEELYERGSDLEQLCKDLLGHFRNLLVVRIADGQNPALDLPDDEIDALREQAREVAFEDVHRWIQMLLKGAGLIVRSPFPKIIMEMTLVDMAYLPSLLPVSDVLAKVERLMERVPQMNPAHPPPKGSAATVSFPKNETHNAPEAKNDPDSTREGEHQSAAHDEISSQWEDALTFVRGENPILASFVSQGTPLHLDDSSLEIGFPKGSFVIDRLSEAATLAALRELIGRHFGRNMALKIVAADNMPIVPERPSAWSSSSSGPAGGKNGVKKKVLDEPLVKEALEIFQGQVLEVKVNDESM